MKNRAWTNLTRTKKRTAVTVWWNLQCAAFQLLNYQMIWCGVHSVHQVEDASWNIVGIFGIVKESQMNARKRLTFFQRDLLLCYSCKTFITAVTFQLESCPLVSQCQCQNYKQSQMVPLCQIWTLHSQMQDRAHWRLPKKYHKIL